MSPGVTLVTGATGFAGRHLLECLDERNPIVAWRRPGGRDAAQGDRVRWESVDVTDRQAVFAAIRKTRPARIFHLAGAPNVATSWEQAATHLRVNALGTHHLLEAVRVTQPDCRVLVVSSGQIYRPGEDPIGEDAPLGPSNPYGRSKLAQDQLAVRAPIDERLDVVIARPFNHIGPRQEAGYAVSSFARQIARIERGLDPPELRAGNLDARRDVTDVRDVVRAYIRIMERAPAGRPYNVCSGSAWSMRDLLEGLLRLTAADIRVQIDPARLRPNDAPVVQGDATRIRTELGWTPTITIDETLRDTLEWWRREIGSVAHHEHDRSHA